MQDPPMPPDESFKFNLRLIVACLFLVPFVPPIVMSRYGWLSRRRWLIAASVCLVASALGFAAAEYVASTETNPTTDPATAASGLLAVAFGLASAGAMTGCLVAALVYRRPNPK
jgi:hypothetical protein